MKQCEQFCNRAGVARQVNHRTPRICAFDVSYKSLRQRLVVFQANHGNRATVLYQAIAQRCV